MARIGITGPTSQATTMEVTETATGGVRRVGGTRTRIFGAGTTHTGAEALLVGPSSASWSESIKAGQWQQHTLCRFSGLIRVAAISGAPTARLRVRIGTAGTTADALAFDSTLRTVADEDVFTFEGWIGCATTGASGTLVGRMNYHISAPDALTVAATEWGQDLVGTTAGTWTLTHDTTADHFLSFFGVTDGVGTDIVPTALWTEWNG